ncbi:hypothetical protein [Sphingobacterium multivorum]|uniref:hypothetical protein n=1 Tax=Sphingobacterium multivorum TaxID=28454 RepID=UPI0028A7813F|nr:hypothetical protein [Sphingobacterium multivorum]
METVKLKKSWLNQVKQSNQERTAKVLEMLQIREADYADMWLDAGIHYLVKVIEVGEWKEEFLNAPLFWKWWLNHWQKWDARFIGYSKEVPAENWTALYDYVHDIEGIELRPHKVILEEIFHKEVVTKLTHGINE